MLAGSRTRRDCDCGTSTSDSAAGDDADLLEPIDGFAVLARSAAALDDWHRAGRLAPRPPGHLRRHVPEHVASWARSPAQALYRVVLDPDGRPSALRRDGGM